MELLEKILRHSTIFQKPLSFRHCFHRKASAERKELRMKQVQQSSDTPAPQKDAVAGSALQDFSLPDERGQRTRDRVLLYVRGMDVAPLRSLAFAAESLGRSGSSPSQAEAMHSLWEVLREEGRLEGREYGLHDGESGKLDSAPPMNRHTMIAEKLDRKPWLTAIGRLFSGHASVSEVNTASPSDRNHTAHGERPHD